MATAVETKWTCDFCGGVWVEEELVRVRQCRDESCAATFNGTGKGDACPECEHASRLVTKQGCPDCLWEEPCEQVQDSVDGGQPDPPKAASADKRAKNQGGAADVESKGEGRARQPLFQHGWMRIEDIRIEDHRSDLAEELESLQRSINKVGLLQLPVVTHEGHLLVCGERRVEALRAQGRTKIPVRFVKNMEDGLRLLVAMRDENKERRPRSPLDADRLANKIKALIAAAAKERQRQGGKLKGKVVGAAHQLGPKGKTRDLVAEFVGVSPRTLKKIEVVKKSGRRELIGKMQKTGNVDAAYKKLMADLPLDMPILQLDGALKRLLPKIQGLVDAITAQEPANASFVEGLAARLIEIGSLGARLQSKGATAKQQPETAKTAKVRIISQAS